MTDVDLNELISKTNDELQDKFTEIDDPIRNDILSHFFDQSDEVNVTVSIEGLSMTRGLLDEGRLVQNPEEKSFIIRVQLELDDAELNELVEDTEELEETIEDFVQDYFKDNFIQEENFATPLSDSILSNDSSLFEFYGIIVSWNNKKFPNRTTI